LHAIDTKNGKTWFFIASARSFLHLAMSLWASASLVGSSEIHLIICLYARLFPVCSRISISRFRVRDNRCHNRISVCGVQWGLFSVRKVRIIFGSFSGPRSEFRSCIDLPSCLYPACQLHLVTFFHHRPQEISRVGFFSGVGNSPVSAGYLVRVAFYRLLLLVLCRDLQPSRVVGEIP
jgi:hypothetical protein